jgi:hypothetical protein
MLMQQLNILYNATYWVNEIIGHFAVFGSLYRELPINAIRAMTMPGLAYRKLMGSSYF